MSNIIDCEKKIKNQFEVLKRIDTYIGTTNTKCTIIMSYCAAAIAFIFTLLSKLELDKTSLLLMVAIGVFSVLALVFAMWCLVLAILTIFPVTYSSPKSHRGESLIFYGDINNFEGGMTGYVNKIREASDAEFLDDLNGQIYTLSTIVTEKFSRIKLLAVLLMVHFASISALLIFGVVYFLF
jgi:hypothetical protein